MQTINLKSAKLVGGVFIFLALLTACKKEIIPTPVPQPVPQPVSQDLKVQFSTAGISIADIDSIVVIIRDQNHYIKKWETMEKASTSFRINLNGLAAGGYTAELLAYSKKRADFTARQFALLKEIVLPLEQAAVVNAPTGIFNDSWYQRAVFFGGQQKAVIIVAMDPRDGYYEVRFKEDKWKLLQIERYSIDVNVLVAAKSKTRNIEGLVGFSEYWDFVSYVEKMNGKNWTQGFITVFVEPQSGGGIAIFDYEYYNN